MACHARRGTKEFPVGVHSDAIYDGVPDPARRHDHAFAAAWKIIAPLAADRGAYGLRIESRDVGCQPGTEASAVADAEEIGRLEMFRQSCMLQDGVGGMAGLYLSVDDEIQLGDRAVPDFVIALSWAHESAARSQ